ncbi:MAG TPA: hypothetical protein VK173_02560, partial [Lacibacter sp.]|nr:hypothetical protein [Lacibacter sp.]
PILYLSIMNRLCIFFLFIFFNACKSNQQLLLTQRKANSVKGSEFYLRTVTMSWQQRDSFATAELLAGNIPDFLRTFVPVSITVTDSINNKKITAVIYVTSDYLSVGTNDDWARVPLTPMAAQKMADSFHCFLPTKKLVDDIYQAAKVKLEPVPMYAFRDSTPTMYQHHLIIEGQRKLQKGLIAGIKKDVVLTEQLKLAGKQYKVAIYGWHYLTGKLIQPVYTGHANWYVDYSHGIRLIYERIKVNGKWMHYRDVADDPVLFRLLTDEPSFSFIRYPY